MGHGRGFTAGRLGAAVVVATLLIPQMWYGGASSAPPLGGADSSTLRREPLLTPGEIGDGSVDGLQYGDPTEGLVIVEPPEASNDGGAHLSYPLVIPKGRGIAPQLSLEYDSGGGNGWVGQGWDLSVGQISVDTRWGAPYFNPDFESETYSLDGDMLIPNALGETWEPRLTGDRQDYTRQVETEYQQIIRHEAPDHDGGEDGGTDDYFWEVHDKGGNVFWYGGLPDQGGPDGYGYLPDTEADPTVVPTIDRDAIVTDEHGNGVRWLLSAQRDVGVNQISYHYTTVHYQYGDDGWIEQSSCTPTDVVLCASHTYLSSINYTEASDIAPAPDGDAEYEVQFKLESEVYPANPLRADPTVDGVGGFVDLVTDRLVRVDVLHGDYTVLTELDADGNVVPDLDADGNEQRTPRDYTPSPDDNTLAIRYDLAYTTGAFGKSLLASVTQVGSDETTSATHTFDYVNRVGTNADGYDGFETTVADWDTGSDLPDRQDLNPDSAIGALGSSESNSGEGHTYVGFNPISPTKVGSFGGSLQIGGGATESIAEWLDINGDGLSDKLYRDSDGVGGDLNDVNRDGPIRYRLNTSGPDRDPTLPPTFGGEETVTGISKLSSEGNFGIEGAFEAFPGVTVAFGLGAEVSWGDAYFSDANADGLPDYVSGGKVWFNHLDASGVPTFVESDSSLTPVPIDDTAAASAVLPDDVQEIQDDLAASNPLVDTVRRWTAPLGGTVEILAPVTLRAGGGAPSDGVRVAIEQDEVEVGSALLELAGAQAFGTPISVPVDAGDDIYFRLGSRDEGVKDDVDWSPTITYTAITGVPPADLPTLATDVNGLSQKEYVAADDFTLSGRPDTMVFMPFEGSVHFSATIDKQKTTDDVKVVLTHTHAGGETEIVLATLLAGDTANDMLVATDVNVAAPVQPTEDFPDLDPFQDSLSVKIVTDTPIDLHAISWDPEIHYNSGIRDGEPLEDPETIAFAMTPEIEQYPHRSPQTVSLPWRTATTTSSRDVHVSFNTDAVSSPAGTAIVTVKTRDGVVARDSVDVPGSVFGVPVSADADLNVVLQADTDYWFDVTIRDPNLSDTVQSLAGFTLTDGTPANDLNPPATLHWTGRQGIFPLAYRGWAVAGYNGDPNDDQPNRDTNPIIESDFEIDIDDDNQPTQPDDPGFGNVGDSDPSQDKSYAYLPAVQLVTIPGQPAPLPTPVWVGNRANMAASADVMRSSRLGLDSVDIGGGSSAGGGRAVSRISVTAPSAKLAFGVGPLGASFGVAPSFGLVDFTDMNGDGYPDVVTPSNVTYTTQRGAYLAAGQDPGELAVTNQDLTLAVNIGIESGLVDIKANSKGKTNATQGGSANKGSDANDSGGGIGIGASFDVSWTSPNASGPSDSPIAGDAANPSDTYADHAEDTGEVEGLPGASAPIQLGLADVNGDGLPDRVFTNPNGVFARYNLGYSFSAPVMLSNGGFESQESYAGGLSLGFSTPWADFSGGVSLNWNIDLSRYAWVDVNGDGILDQIHKINNSDPPTVRFGTGTDMLPAVTYGTMADSTILGIPAGQQSSLDRTNGIGGQFDFTIAIGPLCLVACYLIINPGASYQNSISSTEIDLQDVNGDGYADSLQTLDDNSLLVRENKQADTNLLSSVHNPLGGTISMTYERDGNTVENPKSVWNMVSVEVDDGRPGDGVDVTRTTYAYEGLLADRLHRASLGYSMMTETEIDTDPASPTVGFGLRQTVHTYLNGNVFESGLETSTTVNDLSNGGYIKGVKQTWSLVDVRGGANLTALTTVASLGYSIAPRMLQVVTEVGTGEQTGGVPGDNVGQSSTTNLTYSELGDVIRQEDLGEDEDPNDDVVADMLYSRCPLSSTIGCAGDQPSDNPSPFWDADLCPTWVSLPVDIAISNGKSGDDLQIYRHRNGEGAICDNASVTHLEEDVGDGTVAETELTYDAWGSYDRIVYPLGENGSRYSVLYVWDPDGHATIGQVTEYDLDPETEVICDDGDPTTDDEGTAVDHFLGAGLCALDTYTEGVTSSATFDPLANKVASRTDANGNVTTYGYDPLARLASITSPLTDPVPLVTFEYFVEPDDPHVVAEHYDVFNPDDTIDTAAFSDGIGRVVQTQGDASLFQGAGVPAIDGTIVSGTTIFDTLGRSVKQYHPTASTKAFGVFEDAAPADPVNDPHTVTEYDLWDLPGTITEPGTDPLVPRVTTIVYDYGEVDPGDGVTVYETTETAPNGRQTVTFTDIRDVVRAIDDIPVGAPEKRTTYASDGMGQLLTVTDPNGNLTTHTYDLMGRRLSTETPDGGLVTFTFDADGQQVSKTTPNLRDTNEEITYAYDLHRLVGINYPGEKDDVTYEYGAMGAPGNGAGQVVRLEDGARIVTNVYDAAGNITEQTAEMKLHDWYNNPGGDKTKFQWTMGWSYDGLGRKATVTFPDPDDDPWTNSKVLTYGYDAGGLVNNITGEELGYITVQVGVDEFGNPIFERQPQTWNYQYLQDRQYDVFLRTRLDRLGNGATTEYTFDENTLWLTRQQTISPRPKATTAEYKEIQDLNYTYDEVGNPLTYANNIPAPLSSLFSGPTTQTYTYDPYERIVGGVGEWKQAAKKTRNYTLDITYDEQSNVVTKEQVDELTDGKKETLQYPGTYSFDRDYPGATPHQATGTVTNNKNGVVTDVYEYDLNGNLTGILEPDGDVIRDIDWDANDRMRRITDGPVVTDYAYDDSGQRAIERGASGESAFVNPWLTVVQEKMFQNIWASDDRIGVHRDDGGIFETKQYFLHKDLQGSTNIVSDQVGDTFQHHEYFPTGEVWIDEKSTIFRTPYQYAGGYVDDFRHTINFGARWYDQNREMFYSPDPVLTDDPSAIVGAPALQAAYAYSGSNPLTNVDPGGWEFTKAQRKAFIKANMADARRIVGADPALQATIAANLKTRLPKSLVKLGLDVKSAELHQKRFEMIDDVAKPFVEINISTGEVKLSPGLFKQFTVREGKATQQASTNAPQDATNGTGGPAVNAGAGNNQQDASVAAKKPLPPTPATKPRPPSKPLPPIPQKQDAGGDSAKGSL